MLKTYIISHHSQTTLSDFLSLFSLRPILFHIILKPIGKNGGADFGLRPILFHIILKRFFGSCALAVSLRPILFHIILKRNFK